MMVGLPSREKIVDDSYNDLSFKQGSIGSHLMETSPGIAHDCQSNTKETETNLITLLESHFKKLNERIDTLEQT